MEVNEAALGLPGRVIKDGFDDNLDDIVANHDVDVREISCFFRTQDIMKLASSRWRLTC